MSKSKTIKRTTLITLVCISLLLGLFLAKFTSPLHVTWLIGAIIFSTVIISRKSPLIIISILLATFMFGWWRGGLLQEQNQVYKNNFYEKVTIVATATEDGFYANNGQLEFTVKDASTKSEELPGKIRVRGFGAGQVYRHDTVQVTGKLYPMLGGKQASISYAQVEVIARSTGWVDDFRRNFNAGMANALPEPAASLGVGLLIGQRSLLPDDISLIFLTVGLTHIVAVSGYNLTIIVRGVQSSLRRLSRFQILFFSSSFIYVFLLITGFSPSIVRASIVAGLGLLAWYFGRTFNPILLIVFTAALTASFNPYYVWGDIGWYLSFLAFFGVLVLAPLLTMKIFKQKEIGGLKMVPIESFAAQIMTLPLIMFIFSRFSLVGLLANILVVPLVPFAMFFSLFAGLAGMYIPSIAPWIALPARIILDLMIWISSFFAKIPNALVDTKLSLVGLIVLYVIMVIFIIGLRKNNQFVTIKQRLINSNEAR